MMTRRFWAFVIPALLICLVPAFITGAFADDGEDQSAAVTIGFTVARRQTATVEIGFTKSSGTAAYTITAPGGNVTAPSTARAGDTVTLAYTGEIPAGYKAVFWVNGTKIEGDTFTMPEGAVEITTTLEKVGFAPQDENTPEFAYHSLILSGQIGVEFYAYIPGGYDPDECTVDFDVSGDISENPAGQKSVGTEEIDGAAFHVYRCYVNSVQMADTIHAVLDYGDGLTVSHDYTAKRYLDAVVGDYTLSDDLRELARRIKDYGCYVQPVLAETNGWAVGVEHASMDAETACTDSDFTAAQEATASYAMSRDELPSGIESLSYALVLDSETAVELYLTPSADYSGSVEAFVDGGSSNMAVKKGGEYIVSIGNISAHLLGTTHTVTVKTGDVSFDVRLSAMSYVQSAIHNDSTAMKRAVTALYHYWDAIMTYRNNRPNEYKD